MKIRVNGITLHVEEKGTGDLALVFLHYWGGTARSWKPLMDALPIDLRAIAIDARGWGQSDRPADGYDIATMADDVEAVVASLSLKRYVLVGHSMGGKVAQLLASKRPSGLKGLVLVAPSPARGKSITDREREALRGAYASPEAVAWSIDNVLAERVLPPDLRDQVIAGSFGGAAAAKDFWPTKAIAEDVGGQLARIDVPVLVIGGEADKVDGVDMLRSVVLPALPGAVMTIIPRVGHLMPLEAPHEVAERILDFIAKIPSASAGMTLQPEDIPVAFDEALNRGDIDSVMFLFHPDATMRMTDGTVVDKGPHALRQALSDLIASRPHVRNVVRRVLVSGEIALLLLDWHIRVIVPGQGEIEHRGTATQVAERCADGNWRLRIANPLGIE